MKHHFRLEKKLIFQIKRKITFKFLVANNFTNQNQHSSILTQPMHRQAMACNSIE